MRALCGAIITAGALIGLGLTALGIGTRYQILNKLDGTPGPVLVKISQLDAPFLLLLVFLMIVTLIGLGIAFVGLAHHHHRRLQEMQLAREHRSNGTAHQRTTV
jgi:hypothetical protein